MKILITGHMGLLGSRLAKYLARDFSVYGIDDMTGGLRENVTNGVDNFFFDLCNNSLTDQAFEEIKPDYVYHFAAYAAEGLSPYIRRYNYQNNLIASVNVINACVKYNVKKIIFTSSMAVMGHGNPPFTEIDPVVPADPYGNAKAAVETDLRLAKEHFGLDYSIVRPHNVVGIGQNIFDRYRNVIGIFIRQCLTNQPITIFGDGLQKRAFSDVRYILPSFKRLMEVGSGEIYNIGADRPYTIIKVAEMVKEAAGFRKLDAKIVHLEERKEVKHAYCDHTKARKQLEFVDDTDLETTIDTMFDWAARLKDRPIRKMCYELDKNLYSFWK